MVTPAGLAGIAKYADGVGLNKELVIPRNSVALIRLDFTQAPAIVMA